MYLRMRRFKNATGTRLPRSVRIPLQRKTLPYARVFRAVVILYLKYSRPFFKMEEQRFSKNYRCK